MTPEQIELLEDKARIWRQEAQWGSMELRDYNSRCATALEALLQHYSELSKEGSQND